MVTDRLGSGDARETGRAKAVCAWRSNAAAWAGVAGGLGIFGGVVGHAGAQEPGPGPSQGIRVLPPAPAGVQTVTQQGIEFSIIGSPGNANLEPNPLTQRPLEGRGRVDYVYGISRTEVTRRQWIDFENAIRPFYPTTRGLNGFIDPVTGTSFSPPGWDDVAVQTSPFLALAFCNWLHNDRPTTRDGLLSGVYDLRTVDLTVPFDSLPLGLVASPDARFRLPTFAEWNKATYFDPNRYGQNQPGWWPYPNASETTLVVGDPDAGGQTSAGTGGSGAVLLPTAAYSASQFPWGLFDTSGGEREYIFDSEYLSRGGPWRMGRIGTGVAEDEGSLFFQDNWGQSIEPLTIPLALRFASNGVRIVYTIPSPHSVICVCVVAVIAFGKRRRLS